MTLEEEVKAIFKKFNEKQVHGQSKNKISFNGYDSRNTLMDKLTKKNKKEATD